MSKVFIHKMDASIVLLIQDFLKNDESLICTLTCKTMQKRCKELQYDIKKGRTEKQLVIDAGRFWKEFDIDFQLKNRNKWNVLAKEQFLSHSIYLKK